MTHRQRIVLTLETADDGFEMVNHKNGRTATVGKTKHFRYFLSDHGKGIFAGTDSEDEAYRFLNGTLYPGQPEVIAEMNPFVKPIIGWNGGHPV